MPTRRRLEGTGGSGVSDGGAGCSEECRGSSSFTDWTNTGDITVRTCIRGRRFQVKACRLTCHPCRSERDGLSGLPSPSRLNLYFKQPPTSSDVRTRPGDLWADRVTSAPHLNVQQEVSWASWAAGTYAVGVAIISLLRGCGQRLGTGGGSAQQLGAGGRGRLGAFFVSGAQVLRSPRRCMPETTLVRRRSPIITVNFSTSG